MEEARRPNELLRRARLLRGWSQQRVADHINAPNRQLVYRWETGKRSPGPFYRERLCQEFKMTAEELGLVELTIPDPADAAGTVAGDRAGGTTDGAGDSPLPESVNVLVRELWRDEVKRRAVLQMLAALAAGAALDGAPLQRPPSRSGSACQRGCRSPRPRVPRAQHRGLAARSASRPGNRRWAPRPHPAAASQPCRRQGACASCRSAPATLSSRAGSTRTAATSGRPPTGPTVRWNGPRRSATHTWCPTCWSARPTRLRPRATRRAPSGLPRARCSMGGA